MAEEETVVPRERSFARLRICAGWLHLPALLRFEQRPALAPSVRL